MKFEINMPPCTIVELFDAVATEMGYEDTNKMQYDCTKINIAANIQDNFYERYTELARESDTKILDNDIMVGITQLLIMAGPKVDKSLKANEVEIFDGFIIQ